MDFATLRQLLDISSWELHIMVKGDLLRGDYTFASDPNGFDEPAHSTIRYTLDDEPVHCTALPSLASQLGIT